MTAPNSAPQILRPFDRAEAITIRTAAAIAGRSESKVRGWCGAYSIGRRLAGGPWMVSRIALQMLLDGNRQAPEAYLSGDREGADVRPYFASRQRHQPAETASQEIENENPR